MGIHWEVPTGLSTWIPVPESVLSQPQGHPLGQWMGSDGALLRPQAHCNRTSLVSSPTRSISLQEVRKGTIGPHVQSSDCESPSSEEDGKAQPSLGTYPALNTRACFGSHPPNKLPLPYLTKEETEAQSSSGPEATEWQDRNMILGPSENRPAPLPGPLQTTPWGKRPLLLKGQGGREM